MGAQHLAGLGLLVPVSRFVIRMDVGLDVPRTGLAGRAWCGTACAGVALIFSQLRGRNAVILPVLGEDRQGLLSGLGCVKALGLEGKELLWDGRGCALGGFLQRCLSTLKSRL